VSWRGIGTDGLSRVRDLLAVALAKPDPFFIREIRGSFLGQTVFAAEDAKKGDAEGIEPSVLG
jgi:hypothetical protein